jgi:hypothetical protein
MKEENKRQLPSLVDLHHDVEAAFKNDQLNLLLNQQPKKEWIKEHPYAKGVKYISIDRVETLLSIIFQEWRCEVIEYKQMFNAVSCHVRLHYKNPLTGEWSFHDGIGAVSVQTDAGKSAADLGAIKANAVMLALPAAKTYALKDSAEHLGRLFGRDLNRKDVIEFTGAYSQQGTRWSNPTTDKKQLNGSAAKNA